MANLCQGYSFKVPPRLDPFDDIEIWLDRSFVWTIFGEPKLLSTKIVVSLSMTCWVSLVVCWPTNKRGFLKVERNASQPNL